MDTEFMKENKLENVTLLKDELDYDSCFKKNWNSFVNSDTPKVNLTFNEFLKQMTNEEYLSLALDKIENQNRLISCQFLKEDSFDHGFANFFLMHLPKTYDLCCGSDYYFIYKDKIEVVDDPKKEFFLPRRKTYKKLEIYPETFEYLANFSVPMNEKDRIYCPRCKKIVKREALFGDDKVLSINY